MAGQPAEIVAKIEKKTSPKAKKHLECAKPQNHEIQNHIHGKRNGQEQDRCIR